MRISVDGPSASGKTTLAVALASRLGMRVLDTGLTYRAVAFAALRGPVPPGGRLFTVLRHEPVAPGARPALPAIVYHGEDITDALWSAEVEEQLRLVAAEPAWRRAITEQHRMIMSDHPRVVAVGRDCATTIMADADCHVFLTAAEAVRRHRRYAQFRLRPDRAVTVGPATGLDDVTREHIGHQPHGLVLDTTFLPPSATVRAVLHHLGDLQCPPKPPPTPTSRPGSRSSSGPSSPASPDPSSATATARTRP
ncbi:d(CMP) kinase [Plantactinospora sp. KBS50]|uniref:(d)CMP kinase n=1 Tax=Plantactinospora sp. KBS50 TaxID=2024580 RepID=UPI001E4038C0|nr:(d)CMP kinase [Plantactinospora sp. KBS50]